MIVRLNNENVGDVVAQAADVIKRGGTLVYPTDTIYGIGADATNTAAVEKIFSIKERERGKSLLVLANSVEMVVRFTDEIPEQMKSMLTRYWPGAVTFILPCSGYFPSALLGGKKTIGIRIPHHYFCNALIARTGVPIVSTSANLSGNDGGTVISTIIGEFETKVDLIVDAGDVRDSQPSTIADLTSGHVVMLRQGSVQIKEKLSS